MQTLIRTKGGLNSKLHAVCDGAGRPVIFLFTERQMSDHIDFPSAPVGSRDDCAFVPSTCHFLIKETVDGLKWMGFGAVQALLRDIDIAAAIAIAERGSEECRQQDWIDPWRRFRDRGCHQAHVMMRKAK